jgi:hypothetical protein
MVWVGVVSQWLCLWVCHSDELMSERDAAARLQMPPRHKNATQDDGDDDKLYVTT